MGGFVKVGLALGCAVCLGGGAVGQDVQDGAEQRAVWNRFYTKAITGDRLLFKGVELKLRNIACPDLDSPEGVQAKGLLNTFLRRSGAFSCSFEGDETGVNWARCNVALRSGLKGKDIAQGMRDSGLCEWAADADAQGA